MDKVLLDECEDAPREYPRDPKPTESQASELSIQDARLFEAWATSRDIRQTVFGSCRKTDNNHVAVGITMLGNERDQVAILAEIARRMSKVARVALGARILLDVEKEK